MVQTVKPAAWMVVILICFTGFAGIAWQKNPVTKPAQQDTIPKEKEEGKEQDKTIITGDLDKALEQVEKAQENLEKQLESKDWEKMHRDIEESFGKIDAAKMQQQLAKAMKQIDMQKIQLQTQMALKQIDWQKMQQEIQKAQSELSKNGDEEMQEQIERAMTHAKKSMDKLKAIDMQKIQLQLEKSEEGLKLNEGKIRQDIEKAQENMKLNLHKDWKKELEKAKENINRATEELRNYKSMLEEMEQDGLVKTDDNYSIEYKKGILTIDGKVQPENVTNKYRHYFKKDNVKIKKEKDDEDNRTIEL